ncbi:MAG: DUF115 domain-containing protein [Treponema porcinum]|nr:DUF115 domain-containing protein [Treponema porcinum]
MSENDNDKPCLVETGRGFSVKYKDRLLYSKYDPQKNILQTVQSLKILPGTLILALSPCLGYGLGELSEKLPEDCFIFAVERDEKLFRLTETHCAEKYSEEKKCVLFSPEQLDELPALLNGLTSPFRGKFKRVMRIDFSAGAFLNEKFYTVFYSAMQKSIAQFWKNRITLVKFGKRYSRNFFRNISALKENYKIDGLFKSVSKPILVCGAGESLEIILSAKKNVSGKFYIIAVDAALRAFKARNIHVDAVVCEESQIAISKAFIGCRQYADRAFASLSSCPEAASTAGKSTAFYTTVFDERNFLKQLSASSVLPAAVPPLGSVGLTAVYLSLCLRASTEVPVYIAGLDFSFSPGKTHAKETFPSAQNLLEFNRLNSKKSYAPAFSAGTSAVSDINGRKTVTTVALNGYAELFKQFFCNARNLFDLRNCGLPLNLPNADFTTVSEHLRDESRFSCKQPVPPEKNAENEKISRFFRNEITALEELKDILSNGQNEDSRTRNERIKKLLECREYLYLHFPDGISSSLDIGFLKRIRAETDYFLKLFNQLRCL